MSSGHEPAAPRRDPLGIRPPPTTLRVLDPEPHTLVPTIRPSAPAPSDEACALAPHRMPVFQNGKSKNRMPVWKKTAPGGERLGRSPLRAPASPVAGPEPDPPTMPPRRRARMRVTGNARGGFRLINYRQR